MALGQEDSSTHQHTCLAAVHIGTGHILPLTTTSGGAAAQVHSLQPQPPSILPSRLRPGMDPTYHPGPPHRKRGFILGEANVPIPASVPHAHLHLGLLTPQPPFLSQTYSRNRAGPYQGAPQPGGPGPDSCCRHSVQPTAPLDPSSRRATPSLAGLSRFCPRPMSGRASRLRADLPKPSSDSAAAAVSSLH